MLEYPANQAAGLMGLAPPEGPRLMAVVRHGDDHTELPLLWSLCSALVALGYPVTVLDATKRESESDGGLRQQLDYTFRHNGENLDAPGWSVIPSELGIQSMCAEPESRVQHLRRLGALFPHNGVIILSGRVDLLVPLLKDSGTAPLLAVSARKNSLLTSYLALKRLLLNARIEPTILNMMDARPDNHASAMPTAASSLGECARNFLGYEVNALNIQLSAGEIRPDTDMRRLATHLLESAILLAPSVSSSNARESDRIARSH